MKRIVTIAVLASLMSLGVVAGEKSDRDMAITWNPLSLLGLTLSGSYGIAVSDRVALIVPLGITYVFSGVGDSQSSASSYLFGISSGLGARFYFTGGAFEDGFYIQPNASIGWMKFGAGGVNALFAGGNAVLGYSWVWDSGFMLNLAGGAGYHYVSANTDSKAGVFALHGILPAIEFAIGYAW